MRNIFLGTSCFLLVSTLCCAPVFAKDFSAEMQTPDNKAAEKIVEETPEARAYKMQMMLLSNDIAQKISEIEAKDKEINAEIYPAYRPPLQAEKDNLLRQLKDLQMRQDQLEAQKKSQDFSQQLSHPEKKGASQ